MASLTRALSWSPSHKCEESFCRSGRHAPAQPPLLLSYSPAFLLELLIEIMSEEEKKKHKHFVCYILIFQNIVGFAISSWLSCTPFKALLDFSLCMGSIYVSFSSTGRNQCVGQHLLLGLQKRNCIVKIWYLQTRLQSSQRTPELYFRGKKYVFCNILNYWVNPIGTSWLLCGKDLWVQPGSLWCSSWILTAIDR